MAANQHNPQHSTGGTEEGVDPADGFIKGLLVLTLIASLVSIILVISKLNSNYGVTFGILSEPDFSSSIAEETIHTADADHSLPGTDESIPGTKTQ